MPERPHVIDETCWCKPLIEEHERGVLITHNDAAGVALGTSPKLLAEGQVNDAG